MKLLVLMGAMLLSINAMCEETGSSFSSVTPLKASKVEVLTPKPNCPPGATCLVTTVLKLTYGLNGCADEASVNYTMERADDGKTRVFVSALNLNNPDSAKVLCYKQAERIAVLTLGPGVISKDNVEVVELSNEARLQHR